MAEKIKIDYDEEFNDLYIYKLGKTSDFSVNLGDFVIDVGKGGSINGIEILEATDTISKLLNTRITKKDISEIKDAVIIASTHENALYIHLALESRKDIRVPIVMPAIEA